MAIGSFADFSEMHTSFLQEIANMGAGNAATSLSNMISEATDISVPTVRIISSGEACQLADMLCSRTEAYLITLSGDLKGNILFIIPYQFVSQLVGTFFPGTTVNGKEDMNDMAVSVVQEMVNIAAAAYANNFAIMSGMTVDISIPESVCTPSAKLDISDASACFINTSIEICSSKQSFNVLFFPEIDTIKDFMGRIGIPC